MFERKAERKSPPKDPLSLNDATGKNVESLKDLTDVGIKKTIGYLPIYYLKSMYPDRDFDKEILPMFQKFSNENGLTLKIYFEGIGNKQTTTKSGALYIYHKPSLDLALQEKESLLLERDVFSKKYASRSSDPARHFNFKIMNQK